MKVDLFPKPLTHDGTGCSISENAHSLFAQLCSENSDFVSNGFPNIVGSYLHVVGKPFQLPSVKLEPSQSLARLPILHSSASRMGEC